jgi:hypothetical protein
VGAGSALELSASDAALPEANRWSRRADRHANTLQPGASEDEQPPKAWLVELSDRFDQVPIERDAQATSVEPGVNSRVTLRRSVNVHESGGVIASACWAHSE